jgi:hypothetical protein
MKQKQTENKQAIVGFGNWSNPSDSITRGHCRGQVKEVKDRLQKWCEVVDVDEFECPSYVAIVTMKWQRSM